MTLMSGRRRTHAVKKHQNKAIKRGQARRRQDETPSFWHILRKGTEWIDRLPPKKKALVGLAAIAVVMFLLLIMTGPPVKQRWTTGRVGEPITQQQENVVHPPPTLQLNADFHKKREQKQQRERQLNMG